MFTTGETVGLAEWIIDDTKFLFFFFLYPRGENGDVAKALITPTKLP